MISLALASSASSRSLRRRSRWTSAFCGSAGFRPRGRPSACIAENATGDTWRNLRRDLQQLAAIETIGPDGRLVETTQPTLRHEHIFNACNLKTPPRFLGIDLA
ncbi:MAG: hypothetical protein GEU78_10700 [Actinobacteria bacterium]|nr:hypothetical protein [Actinomycetota bacterium]